MPYFESIRNAQSRIANTSLLLHTVCARPTILHQLPFQIELTCTIVSGSVLHRGNSLQQYATLALHYNLLA